MNWPTDEEWASAMDKIMHDAMSSILKSRVLKPLHLGVHDKDRFAASMLKQWLEVSYGPEEDAA